MKHFVIGLLLLLWSLGFQAQSPVFTGAFALFPTNPNGPNVGGFQIAVRKNFNFKHHPSSFSWNVAASMASNEAFVDKHFFMMDVPIYFAYNLGYGSRGISGRGLGWFLGGGLGVHYMSDMGYGLGPEMVVGWRAKLLKLPLEFGANYRPDPLKLTLPVFRMHVGLMLDDSSLDIFDRPGTLKTDPNRFSH